MSDEDFEDESIIDGRSMIRHSGNVDVMTIPSHIVKTVPVKRVLNKILKVEVKRRGPRKYILEVALEEVEVR